MELLETLGIILLIAGFVLIGVEMVMPGFGAPGISGIVCLIVGIFMTADTLEEGITITVIVIVILGILMTIIMSLLTHRKFKSPIILDEAVSASDVHINSSDLDYLLHKEGIAVTDLRPAGKGDFEGIVLDVFSEGAYIEKGSLIIISKVNKNQLLVKKK